MMYPELLWAFSRLPDHYVVLDTETTGLPDEKGLPDIVTLGLTVVNDRSLVEATEFSIRSQRSITKEAEAIHGISNEQAASFKPFDSQWPEIAEIFHNQLVIIHNASFDWPVLLNQLKRTGLEQPKTSGVFCSQKAAIPWAQANNLECSYRGPSLDTLTAILEVEDLRNAMDGVHGAKIDSQQTACVVEKLRRLALLC